jgi:two-component system, sporulation sensor kinase A
MLHGHARAELGEARHAPSGPASRRVEVSASLESATEVRAADHELRAATRRANRRIALLGHLSLWFAVCFFLLVVAGPWPALVVALSWGIGVVAHGFFGVIGPELRSRWVEREIAERVDVGMTGERRALEDKHARSIEELAASVAHEIRNPITAAKSLVQQIGEDPSASDNAEYAAIAVAELDRVERAVSHLLRYAREEPLRASPVFLGEVVESALDTLRERIGSSAVSVEREVDPAVMFDADADKVRRVVINLVSNALDALEECAYPSATIVVAGGYDLAGNAVWLRVRDDGPGIAEDALAGIWSPFHTSKKDGTGLGLAITKKLVEMHGGHIELTTEVGSGTEFSLTFPRYVGKGLASP